MMHVRSSTFAPSSYDPATRRIEAVLSTFADVARRDARGPYVERLDPSGLDASSLVGAPLLDSHRQGAARDVLGVLESVRMEGGALIGVIKLSAAPDVVSATTKIIEGALRGVSLGYRVTAQRESVENGKRVVTATAFKPVELSAVAIPADPEARFRSHGENQMEQTVETEIVETQVMSDADQQRVRSLVELADLQPSFAESLITRNATPEEARTAVRDELRRRAADQPRIRVVANAPNDDPRVILQRRVDALSVRTMGGELAPEARPFAHDRLIDHARASVERTGVSTRGLSPDEIFQRAMHGTSDFPMLLQGVGNRSLMPAYQAAASPLKRLARQSSATDFRPKSALRLSGIGSLQPVSEHGEITHATRSETSESYALETFGRIFSLSRKALVNDDLSAFADFNAAAGRAAAQTEANVLWGLLAANNLRGVKMSDAKPLFHADHRNLMATAGKSFAEDSAGAAKAARLAMARQTDASGELISVAPKYLLVSPENEDEARAMLAAIYPPTTADVNANAGRGYEVLTDARIKTGDVWFFADPAALPVLEYAYLSSAPGPQLATRQGWETLGTEWRVHLDFGAGALDWRGAYLVADI